MFFFIGVFLANPIDNKELFVIYPFFLLLIESHFSCISVRLDYQVNEQEGSKENFNNRQQKLQNVVNVMAVIYQSPNIIQKHI